jgi:aryl-alcohol dehydrogenase-like predicted oxidoreductase
MNKKFLGSLEVSAVGLGCMPMSWGYDVKSADKAESRATLHRAIELGVTLLDTADVYGPFTNEELLGECISADGLREQVVLATKVGLLPESSTGYGKDGSPEHIRKSCNASLTRLQTDYIDIYQLHRVDPSTPIEVTVEAMAQLVAAGKVKHIGLSEVTVDELKRAQAVHPIASVQSELSIWTSENSDNGVLDYCNSNGIGFLAFSPLGRGFLTGKLDSSTIDESDFRSANPRFTPEALAANQQIVDGIQVVAARHGVSAAQISLAWVMAQGPNVVPIPGTKRRKWLEDNCASVNVVLTQQDLTDLGNLPKSVAPRY